MTTKNDLDAFIFLFDAGLDLDLMKEQMENDKNLEFRDFYLNKIGVIDETIRSVCDYLANKGAQEDENEKTKTNSNKSI